MLAAATKIIFNINTEVYNKFRAKLTLLKFYKNNINIFSDNISLYIILERRGELNYIINFILGVKLSRL